MKKLLTIGVPSYNAEKTLDECLTSFIIPEIMDSYEVIIINDGSKDRTSEIAEKYTKLYPKTFKLINKENGGHGSGINTTIKYASGQYIKIVDSDDTVLKDGMIELMRALEETNADILFSPYIRTNVDTNYVERISYEETTKTVDYNKDLPLYNGKNFSIAMAGITYKASLLKENDYKIDEKCFYVDVEYTIYYCMSAKVIHCLKKELYNYHVGQAEQSVNIKNMINRRDQHLHVCKQLISFFEKQKNNMNEINRKIIKNNIIHMALINEVEILSKIDNNKTSLSEMKNFVTYVQKNSDDIYNELFSFKCGKKCGVIKLLSRLNFFPYSLFYYAVNR